MYRIKKNYYKILAALTFLELNFAVVVAILTSEGKNLNSPSASDGRRFVHECRCPIRDLQKGATIAVKGRKR